MRDAYRRGLVTSITNVVVFPVDGSISPDASYYLGSQNGGLTNTYVYSYDALSRPVRRNGTVFGYNARSEVTHDGSIGAWYSYDEIGNQVGYNANELNQYIGTAYSYSGETVEEYSPDGEMLANEDWRYYYDAKSRLVSVSEWRYVDIDNPYPTNRVEVVVLSNRYDHLDRRIQKITPEATHSYFYDGWLLVKEVVAKTNGTTDVVEYHWGNDLSCSRTGAAGIGGLLYLTISNSSTPNSSTRQLYIPWYDNSGNVMGYWDERGKVAASFSYGAFGETYASGDNANKFPIRFSTKYHDVESGLYYYTKRFYAPLLHRWLTRDPIGENGGENLYDFCGNNPISENDFLGLKWKIIREGTVFATAIPQDRNDTFISLAREVGLDISDYPKWAHTSDRKPIICKKYQIPNTKIYHKGVRRFYENWINSIIGNWDSDNNAKMDKDRINGFNVVLKESIGNCDVQSDLGFDGLYEYTFTGHGLGAGSIATEDFDSSVDPVRATMYGIHRLTLQGCDTANDMIVNHSVMSVGWCSNVAVAGTFVGYIGKVNLFNESSRKRRRKGANSRLVIIMRGTNR